MPLLSACYIFSEIYEGGVVPMGGIFSAHSVFDLDPVLTGIAAKKPHQLRVAQDLPGILAEPDPKISCKKFLHHPERPERKTFGPLSCPFF